MNPFASFVDSSQQSNFVMYNSFTPITTSYSDINQVSCPTLSLNFLSKFTDILTSSEIKLLRNPPYNTTTSLEILLDPISKTNAEKISPPRPQNAWVIFRKDFENQLRRLYPNEPHTVQDISKAASKLWKKQSDDVKKYFKLLSKMAHKLHKKTYPDYRYKPSVGRPKKIKNELAFVILDKNTFEKPEYIPKRISQEDKREVCVQDIVCENEHYQTNNCITVQHDITQCSNNNEDLLYFYTYYALNNIVVDNSVDTSSLVNESQISFNAQININSAYETFNNQIESLFLETDFINGSSPTYYY